MEPSLNRRTIDSIITIGAAIVIAVLDPLIARAHGGWPPLAIAQMIGVIIVVAAGLIVITDRKVGLILTVVISLLVVNDVLFENNYVTFLNFGEFSLASSADPMVVRVSIFAIIAMLALLAARARRRMWLYLLFAFLLLVSVPSKLSGGFFI